MYQSDHNATCDSDGTKTAKCVRYGTGGCTETDTLPDVGSALGHIFLLSDYLSNHDETCLHDGTKTAKCVRYGTGGCTATMIVPDINSRLCHWYGEWTRAGEGAHRANCRRDDCMYTAERACETATVSVGGVEMTFCPVCGTGLAGGNATALAAEPMTGDALPRGEWIVRRAALADGAEALTFAYEYAGRPVKMTGVHRVAVSAAALEGLTTAEGAPFETDGKQIILTVDFSDAAQGDFVRVVPLSRSI